MFKKIVLPWLASAFALCTYSATADAMPLVLPGDHGFLVYSNNYVWRVLNDGKATITNLNSDGFDAGAYGGGKWILNGGNNQLYQSSDGVSWTKVVPKIVPAYSQGLYGGSGARINYFRGLFVSSFMNSYCVSKDGTSWSCFKPGGVQFGAGTNVIYSSPTIECGGRLIKYDNLEISGLSGIKRKTAIIGIDIDSRKEDVLKILPSGYLPIGNMHACSGSLIITSKSISDNGAPKGDFLGIFNVDTNQFTIHKLPGISMLVDAWAAGNGQTTVIAPMGRPGHDLNLVLTIRDGSFKVTQAPFQLGQLSYNGKMFVYVSTGGFSGKSKIYFSRTGSEWKLLR